MTFPYAHEGIKKVFTAQILVLISAGCALLGGLISGVSVIGGSLAGAGGGAVFLMGAAVLSILSLIFNLIGLNRASKDESSFKTAFICTLISLIVSILFNIISSFNEGVWSDISTIITTVLSIVITVYIFRGTGNLAARLGNSDVPVFGKPIMVLLITVDAVTIFVTLMSMIVSVYSFLSFVGVVSTLASIASIVGYILYLVYLNRAVHMLEL